MAVLLDASAILAAADRADLNHAAAAAWFERVDEPLLIGALTLAEADHLLQRELGLPATLALVAALTSGARMRSSAPPPSIARACRTRSWSPRPSDSASAGSPRSTAARLRSLPHA